jgi:hypothetical protein
MPANLIGLPVTARIDSAAPPRTGQRVDDEQNFLRLRDVGNRLHLVHQLLVDVQAACSVEHQHVEALQLRRLHRTTTDIDRLLTRDDRQGRDLDLGAEHRQLFLRGRAIDVERRHHHLLALLLEQAGELGGGGGLARTLQADHHDHGGRGDVDLKLGSVGAEHRDQRVIDDLDDLLPRRDRAQHLLADRFLGHLVDELAGDRQRDVSLEQRDTHFAHRGPHIRFGQRATALETVKYAAKPFAQTVKHSLLPLLSRPKRIKRRRTKPRQPALPGGICRRVRENGRRRA